MNLVKAFSCIYLPGVSFFSSVKFTCFTTVSESVDFNEHVWSRLPTPLKQN